VRGRPAGPTADLRARLLDTAIALFARHGIAATPLTAIAAKARVAPALLHYYFGSRAKLIDAVVEERLAPLFEGVAARLAAADAGPAALIGGFVRGVFAIIDANPWLPALWVREVLTDGGQLRARLIGRFAPQVALRLRDLAATAQRRGELNRDLDPRLLAVSLVGLTVFAHVGAPIWRPLFSADDVTPDVLTRHVLALLARGLELPHALD